ncbi:MAG: carboxylesterase family protein [Deltaproteobacteria bacterium]|nr:carboxylesterase family protein [Deltaproteobacteria bacterium]
MARKRIILFAVVAFVLAVPGTGQAWWDWHWAWDFSAIESPDCGERLDFEPVRVVVQLTDAAKPSTFKAWLNGKRIPKTEDNYTYDPTNRRVILTLGPEDGLRVKEDGPWGWNFLRTEVKGKTWNWRWWRHRRATKTDVDNSWFFVKARGLTRDTIYGRVRGFEVTDDAWAWKSLPFAKPPVGELRWRAPQDPKPWKGVYEATEECTPCTQLITSSDWIRQETAEGSEDCLYLNVFRPRSAEKELPVYVYIHGGSNNFGKAAHYDGSILAARSNLVVVVVQYRLGPLGWFTHPALRHGDALDDSGNFGTLDNIKALEWIRDNIKAFGGNPDNVTITGESAGAHNVMNVVISPLAAGLFHRAMSESGGMVTIPVEEGEALANSNIQLLLARYGDTWEEWETWSLDEQEAYLRSADAKDLYEVLYGSIGVRDGVVIPGSVVSTIRSGDYNKVPIILGANEQETKAFLPLYGPAVKYAGLWGGGPWPGVPSSSYTWYDLTGVLKGDIPSLDDVLPTVADKALYDICGTYGSLNWRAKFVDERARALAEQQDHVYAYLFKWGGPGSGPEPFDFIYGAGHAMEISFFFGGDTSLWGYGYNPDNDTEGRRALQDAMMRYLANFARTGNPNEPKPLGFEWRPWSNEAGEPKVIVFDSDMDDAILNMSTEEVTFDSVNRALYLATLGLPEEVRDLPWYFQWAVPEP